MKREYGSSEFLTTNLWHSLQVFPQVEHHSNPHNAKRKFIWVNGLHLGDWYQQGL